jgi:DNA-3-methyladenine glycosylase I
MPLGQAPPQVDATKPGDFLEVMTRAVFQSGISWKVVEAKWPGMRRAFANFDAKKVARLGPEDVDRLMADASVIRNRRKIEATIENAVELLALDKEYGGFREYLRSHGSFEELVADLRRRFKFLGDTGSYYFLHVVGEQVPSHEEWMQRRRR